MIESIFPKRGLISVNYQQVEEEIDCKVKQKLRSGNLRFFRYSYRSHLSRHLPFSLISVSHSWWSGKK